MVDASRWDAALEAAADACNARAGQLIALDAEHNPTGHWISGMPEDFPEQLHTYGFADPRSNPRFGAGLNAPLMTPIADQNYASADTRRKSSIYRDIFDPNDLPFNCQAVLVRDDQAFVRASITRSRRQGPLDADAFAAFTALLPYFHAAVRVQMNLALNERNAVLRTLDTLDAAAFVLGDDGAVLGMSRSAAAMTTAGDLVMLSGGRLKLSSENDQTRFAPMIARCLAAAKGQLASSAEPLILSGRPQVLEAYPMPRSHLFVAGAPAVMVFVRPARKDERTRLLRGVYRLTDAEAQIASAVADGSTLAELAKQRGASIATVRSQLQAVFAKLGVQRQSELVRRFAPQGLA